MGGGLAAVTEIATDTLWSRSAAFTRPGARLGMRAAGVFNLGVALGFAGLASRDSAAR